MNLNLDPHGDAALAETTAAASILSAAGSAERGDALGVYSITCTGADGEVKWVEEFDNLVTTVGKNYLLDNALAGSSFTAAWYMGLVDGGSAPTYSANDTMASHAGWTENVAYSQAARPTVSFNAASGGSKASNGVSFSVNAGATLAGCFLSTVSTKSGTTGTLLSVGSFASSRTLANGDTLTVTYTLSI